MGGDSHHPSSKFMSEGSVLAHSAPDTLAEHSPYERKRLIPKAVDRLIKSTKKRPDQKQGLSPRDAAHLRHDPSGQWE